MRLIITGAGAGIGRTVAEAFSAQGATVALCDTNENVFADLSAAFYKQRADVADENDMQNFMTNALNFLGGVDVLINNAGGGGPQGPMETLDAAQWRHCLAVGAHGLFYAARAVIPAMKNQRAGCIINMSSNAGLYPLPDRSPYTAAKWAIIGLTKTLAMELGEYNIRVNAICPGSVEGARIDGVIAKDAAGRQLPAQQVRNEYQKQSSLRCFATADDIAAMALFLASPAGARISGQAIGIDGHTETLGRIT